MDLGSGEDVSFPYEQKLTFVDGLSLLKDIDFVDLSDTSTPAGSTIPLNERIQGNYDRLNMYYGPALYTFWIKEILLKAGVAISGVNGQGVSIDYGFTTAVNWYNADMQNTNQGSDPLGLTKCVVSMFHNKNDQDVFTPENCYTVLKELLRHWGARITYWKHEFWIVQIPEYIQDESGLIDNPDNINSRQYNRFGTLTGSQDHLGDTFYTRYEQTIQSNQVSKLVGTKYNYLPMIHNAEADFLSFASKNYYGGFPYGVSAESQEIFQGTIIDPSTANFLWLSIPLNWTWDMTGSSLTSHRWWCSVKFNFYASDGTTTYYLQYDSSNNGSYYWVLEADWTPLGNTSPKYIIKSSNLTETNYIGFQQDIPFVDSAGSTITMTGAWSFFLDIEDYGSSSSNPGSFFCRFSGYGTSNFIKRNPTSTSPNLPFGSGSTSSGKVSWSNTLENPSGIVVASPSTPVGFDAGTTQDDIQLITTSAFKGYLQTLNTTQTSSFGLSLNTQVNNSTNTEKFSFGTLIWGDAIQQFAVGCLRVNNGSAFVKTNPDGEWGRGILTGDKTFTELLIDEFLNGQIKVVIAPTMRLAVGDANKNQTATGTGGPATRPRYVNPIGRLRETRTNETDPEYIFRRGSFHSLYDEWDYEGYQILRDTVSATTTTNDIGDLGGTQDNKPISDAKLIPNVTDALMLNSSVASIRTTVPATGSNVAVNGNFNTAVGWTLGSGWSIDTTAKKAKFAATGSTSELTQSVLTQGLTYQVNFKVVVTAGTLLVKTGTSGTSQSITTSGDYSIYLNCDGSNLIKFQAGTTFTGNITYITLRDQKSISSVPINSIGSTVFKSGDTFNLINSLGGEILPLTVSSNQGATDDTISVTSTALFDDIGIDSVLLINQDDLSAQYQNKTKGTVAGFGIDADGISKGGIEITGWLNSNTMSGAAVTNVPTALSVKNYVDGQVGASDTLQEVTDNGNTTTNSVMIGSSAAPDVTLHIDDTVKIGDRTGNNGSLILQSQGGPTATLSQSGDILNLSGSTGAATGQALIFNNDFNRIEFANSVGGTIKINRANVGSLSTNKGGINIQQQDSTASNGKATFLSNDTNGVLLRSTSYGGAGSAGNILFQFGGGDAGATVEEKMRLTSGGNLGIGTTSPSYGVDIHKNGNAFRVANSGGFDIFRITQGALYPIYGVKRTSIYSSLVSANAFETMDSLNIKAFKAGGNHNGVKIKGITIEYGTDFNPSGNLEYAIGVHSKFSSSRGAGVNITSLYGFYHEATNTNSLTITNQYGLYLADSGVATNKYGIYQVGNSFTNYFEGQLTIPATPVASTDAASKSYVDAQVSATDSLQEVTTIGNTTTNSIMIGSSSSPSEKLEVNGIVKVVHTDNSYAKYRGQGVFFNRATSYLAPEVDNFASLNVGYNGARWGNVLINGAFIKFSNGATESMRISSSNNVLIGTTTDSGVALSVKKDSGSSISEVAHFVGGGSTDDKSQISVGGNTSSALVSFGFRNTGTGFGYISNASDVEVITIDGANSKVGINTLSPTEKLHVVGKGIFTDQLTIPATPVASTDAASKGYVDAQVGSADTLQEVTDNGNTTTNAITFAGGTSTGNFEVNKGSAAISVVEAGGANLKMVAGGSTGYVGTYNNTNLTFVTNSSEKMRLTSGGNLGIGTSSPASKLHINRSDNGELLRLQDTFKY